MDSENTDVLGYFYIEIDVNCHTSGHKLSSDMDQEDISPSYAVSCISSEVPGYCQYWSRWKTGLIQNGSAYVFEVLTMLISYE